MNRRGFGTDGELDARAWLASKGMAPLAMNYRRRTGEIDIIARDGDTLVFIEVKRRTSLRYGRPAEAVTAAKRARIVATAALYLQEKGIDDAPVRFDVVELTPGRVNHIENAFMAGE